MTGTFKPKKKKFTYHEIHPDHLKAALLEYLPRYTEEIDDIELLNSDLHPFTDTIHIRIEFHNKKENNAKDTTSVYDALPCDIEPA
jgi:hypothetical protein